MNLPGIALRPAQVLQWVLAVAWAVVCSGELAQAEPPTNRYNVLFIAVDDLRPELGCYGVPHAQSPHLDALAAEGVVFTQHFVQVATCGASRYALLTGRSPAKSGVTSNNTALYQGKSALRQTRQPGAQSLPELFRRSGYRTVCLGKISHTPDGKVYAYDGQGDGRAELPHAWDALPTPYGPWQRGWGAFFAYAGGRHREDGKGHRDRLEFQAQQDEDLPDGLIAAAAVEQLAALKKAEQPFFLGVGFFKPHLPFVATQGDWEALAKVDVPPPPQPNRPETAYWHGSGEFNGYRTTPEQNQPLAARRAYLACVRYVDRQIGKVLAALEQNGLADSTIVVVWGDHGWHLGDSQIWGKHTSLERALHSPLILRVPKLPSSGTQIPALVETLDLYPTLVELCQPSFQATAYPLDGKSLVPLLTNQKQQIRPAALSYWGNAITVRTEQYRLIAKQQKEGMTNLELYDLRQGPDPTENLAAQKPQVVKRLLTHLRSPSENEPPARPVPPASPIP